MRTLVLGDVHGCLTALEALLDLVAPAADDRLIALGDYVDRGPDSRGVLDRLIPQYDKGRLIPLRGNHDEMMVEEGHLCQQKGLWRAVGGVETLWSYGHEASDPAPYDKVPARHWRFLEHDCRDWFETDTHIFVHANYFADVPMAEQHVGMLRWESLREMTPGPHESGKTVIVGHTSQKGGEILDLGHLKCIDTYCHGGGWLTALDAATGEAWQADREGNLRPGSA